MQYLFLNLASHDALVACVDDASVCASASVSHRIGDHELIPLVEQVLSEAGWSYTNLHRIACVTGPGGFTSLRIAVTYANVLRDQLGIESAGVHLSDLYRGRVLGVGGGDVYWLHSTKKDQLFVQGGEWDEPTLISIKDLQSTIYNLQSLHWCGELIDEHQAIVGCDPIDVLPVRDILPAFLAKQNFQQKSLEPWYGRGW